MCCICCCCLRGLSHHLIWCRLRLLAPNEGPHCYWRSRNSGRRPGRLRSHAPTWNRQALGFVKENSQVFFFLFSFLFCHSCSIASQCAAPGTGFSPEKPTLVLELSRDTSVTIYTMLWERKDGKEKTVLWWGTFQQSSLTVCYKQCIPIYSLP